jgi:hypothetical protein
MSDATAVATAIPREINLGLQKPVATPAYTRRFKSNASNPVVTAGSQVTITLDTAQPGSFIDTLSSYLSFKLDLINPSTTSGYNVSFSAAGAHALFRAMRIYVQGVPIEEITEYNALVEWLHDMAGIPDYCDRSAKGKYFSNTMMSDQTIYLPPATTGAGGTVYTRRSMNIQLPLISGVLGSMAEKMFPSMLVAPGNCYIQLDLAQAAHALRIVEVDLTNLLVGTAPVLQGGSAHGKSRMLDVSDIAVVAPAATSYIAASEAEVNGASAILNPGVETILGEGPFDAPFGIGDGAAGNPCGILTTEERLGGGMWYNAAGSNGVYATVGAPLMVSDDVGPTPAAGQAVTAISNLADVAASNAIFLGSGVDTVGGGVAGRNNQRCTLSGSIGVTYEVRDLEFVGKQVVVGDDVARAIIERAAAGDISIHTQSYRQYPATIPLTGRWQYRIDPAYNQIGQATTLPLYSGAPLCNMTQRYNQPGGQSIIVPAKISSANAIYFIFRNSAAENDFRFDSLRRMTIGMTDDPSASPYTAQLRIGNELIPQSPIASASEALEELLKAHHMGGYYGTCEKFGSIVASSAQFAWPQAASYMLRRGVATNDVRSATVASGGPIGRATSTELDAATAAGTTGGVVYARNDFNSQILAVPGHSVSIKYRAFGDYSAAAGGTSFYGTLSNAAAANFYQPLTKSAQNYNLTKVTPGGALTLTQYVESQEDYANRQRRWKNAVKVALFGYADERSDHQLSDPTKPNFMNPYKQHAGRYSTFMLGFDLDTFSHNTDVVRSGHYLGNNTVSLNLSGMEIVDNSPMNMPLCNSVRMDTYVLHDLRLSFQAGGIVQAFY